MAQTYAFTTFSTYSARKGTIFFSIHKRLHTKKTQNMLQNILLTALLLEVRLIEKSANLLWKFADLPSPFAYSL
jgi:predicted membrane chloride channel (bestrophin family)